MGLQATARRLSPSLLLSSVPCVARPFTACIPALRSVEEAALSPRRLPAEGQGGAAAAAAATCSASRGSRRGKRTRAWELGSMKPLAADIVSAGALVLRQPAEEVPESMFGSQELEELVSKMIDTMRAAPGVGLAAPQIGVPLQVIVLEDKEEYIAAMPEGAAELVQRVPFEPLVVVNPRLRALSQDGMRFFEGCLSVPHYQALVERFTSVEVEGRTADGRPLKLQAHGWKARILQHEVDHLRGTLYVDRMLTRSFSLRGSGQRVPDDVPRPGPCTCCHVIDAAVR